MPDFTTGRETRTAGAVIDRVFTQGVEAGFIFGNGTQIFPNLPVQLYGTTEVRDVVDDAGVWFEFGFTIDAVLTGNGAAGYTDAGNYLRLEIQQSGDLQTWHMGRFVPAAVPVEDNGDGSWTYWSRGTIPRLWKFVTVDLAATTNRQGKSITGIELFGVAISLPGYPYAMPAAAATLQSHIRAAGYAGATVTTAAAALSVQITNHLVSGRKNLVVTMSGTSVTAVADHGGPTISLPGYPYAMPSAQAALQSALRTAGKTGAVVMLYDDPWTVMIPDQSTILNERRFDLTIAPGDPFPQWDVFGNYQGLAPATAVPGASGNTRATTGLAPLDEAGRQFARLKISAGTRYNLYL